MSEIPVTELGAVWRDIMRAERYEGITPEDYAIDLERSLVAYPVVAVSDLLWNNGEVEMCNFRGCPRMRTLAGSNEAHDFPHSAGCPVGIAALEAEQA